MTLTPAASIENPPPVVIVAFYLLPEYWAWENTYVAPSQREVVKKRRGRYRVSIQGVKSLWGIALLFQDWAPGTLRGGA